jgi:galactokinase
MEGFMPDRTKIADAIKNGGFDAMLTTLYGTKGGMPGKQKARYIGVIESFAELFPEKAEIDLFSTPGRTEVGGNHTDHNAGRVLAATVNLDALAAAAKNGDGIIRVHSEGYPPEKLDINSLAPADSEKYTSAALIRGVCARAKELGYNIGGFDAYVTSDVLKGSGLSSSAAYEVLIMTILNHFYNGGKIDDITVAMIAQHAENNYFGKPCGLMDMTTCSVGGFVTIDFQDFDNPKVDKVDFDFAHSGYAMVIVDTGGSHADLNEDYALLEHEMKDVARFFGGQALREFSAAMVLGSITELRGKVSDRAILRALHFFADDQRVVDQVGALRGGDFERFKELIIDSGYSSWMLCQNCYSSHAVHEQGVSVSLAVSESILKGKGAWRVHGGGFAGTIQAFVPDELLDEYVAAMKAIFGVGSCYELIIRPYGSLKLEII